MYRAFLWSQKEGIGHTAVRALKAVMRQASRDIDGVFGQGVETRNLSQV